MTPARRMHRATATLLLGLLTGSTTMCGGEDADAPRRSGSGGARARNLLLISIDTLRPDFLGSYGYERPSSPQIDLLASEGVVFEQAMTTAPWTLPAHGSLLTGLYPRHHGANAKRSGLVPGVVTLAEVMKAHGFRTAAILNSRWLGERYGFDRGFDDFSILPPRETRFGEITDRALEWLSEGGQSPFFLLVHDFHVHSDYGSEPPYQELFVGPYEGVADGTTEQLRKVRTGELELTSADRDHLLDLYAAGVRGADHQVGRLVAHLRDQGVLDETLVVVVSDHGEEFFEHGGVLHGRTQYQEIMQVPLILRGPGIPAGARIATPASLVDVVPTALSLLGLPVPDALDGMDLRPLWSAVHDPARAGLEGRALFGEADHNNSETAVTSSVRRGAYKLITNRVSGTSELYDLSTDPREQRNLLTSEPEVAAALGEVLERFVAGSRRERQLPELSSEMRADLEALGYLEDAPARAEGPAASQARPDVLLVTIDTLRADRLGAYGYPRPTSPGFDRLASGGALFEVAYAPMGATSPSHATLFTSRSPLAHGLVRNGFPFAPTEPTLAEVLRASGYRTGGFVSAYPVGRKLGFDRGFDHFDDDFSAGTGSFRAGEEEATWEGEALRGGFDRSGPATVDAALRWLEGGSPQPIFLWVHLFDPHRPYTPPDRFAKLFTDPKQTRREKSAALYDAEIRGVDAELERLVLAFEALSTSPLVLVTADHGEGLWQHGYRSHGHTLYEEELRVPLLFRWPDRIPPQRVQQPAHLIDVFPTLLGLLGLEADGSLDGVDLGPYLTGEKQVEVVADRPIFLQRPYYEEGRRTGNRVERGHGLGVRSGRWKLIEMEQEQRRELYDLQADPHELEDLSERELRRAAELSSLLSKWRESEERKSTGPGLQVSPEDREAMRALGYTE